VVVEVLHVAPFLMSVLEKCLEPEEGEVEQLFVS